MRCRIQAHAWQRYQERVGVDRCRRVAGTIDRALKSALLVGVTPDKWGAVHIPTAEGWTAIAYPSQFGGWDVVTIYIPSGRDVG